MISLSGSCPNIHATATAEEETLCPLPQQKKNSWKWLSLPHSGRSPLGGRRFSWNSLGSSLPKSRSKRSPLKISAQTSGNEQHPLLTTSRARSHSTSGIAIDDVDGTAYSRVEDSFAQIKHQLVSAFIFCCNNASGN